MTSQTTSTVFVAGMGLVGALGTDVATNCAAARAGIVRSQVLENYRLRSDVEGRDEPVIGHAATLLTRGFEGQTRLMRLATGALVDLLRQTRNIDWQTRSVAFYVSLPDPFRAHPETPDSAQEARSLVEEAAERILQRAAGLAAWPGTISLVRVTSSGHAGGLQAIQSAIADLNIGKSDTAVVLAADSLLDERTLVWLHTRNRLKCDGAPDGLQPGEAGVAIVLTTSPPDAPADAGIPRVAAVHEGEDPRHLLSDYPPRGEVLAQLLLRAWSDASIRSPWLILDQNGEVHRAMEWGHALVRMRACTEAFASPEVWYPATSFGDTGAASGLLGLCTAVRAWHRHYAPADAAIIASVSDGPSRAALAVSRN